MRVPSFTERDLEKLSGLAKRAEQILLTDNLYKVSLCETPILLVGATYPGVWLEHNQDALFLARLLPEAREIAWANVEIFLRRQRGDGLLPFCIPKIYGAGQFFPEDAVYWQVQSVFPFVRCATEICEVTGRSREDFLRIYQAGCRYDGWFRRFRDRGGSGLVEMFCEYDTGHDDSPRVLAGGLPHSCPGGDAINMPELPCMPVQAADLSATRYGDRMALAALADKLGFREEALKWRRDAMAIREKMDELLYDSESDYYYDRDTRGLRKYRTEHITRIFLSGMLCQEEFDRIYQRYFNDASEFDTPFPYPAVSVSDPSFVRSCPRNCWGANCQALTALRALIWLQDYHRKEELECLLGEWARVLIDSDGDFGQEVNPFTREILPSAGKYTPTLLLCLEAAKRFCH